MNVIAKKTLILMMVAVLIGMSCVPKRAEAVVPVVVAGAAVGTFVGVVAIGAIALDVFGQAEQADRTMAYAEAVWMTSEQWAKDQVMNAYNTAAAAGDKVMTLSSQVVDYLAGRYEQVVTAEQYKFDDSVYQGISVSSKSTAYGRSYGVYAPVGYTFFTAFGIVDHVRLYINYTEKYGDYIEYQNGTLPVAGTKTVDYPSYTSDAVAPQGDVMAQVVYGLVLSPLLVPNTYKPGANLPRARDAFPVAMPVPQPGDFVYTPVKNPGVDVYQKGDQLVDDAGKIYTPDQVKVKVAPQTKVPTDAAGNPIKDAAGNPVLGVPVGAVAGNPAIPGTIVNVKTGEAVKTETGTDTANPPFDWTSKPAADSSAAKLKALVTTKFPFSLPWDMMAVLGFLNADPKRPEIKVDQKFMGMPFKFNVTFEYLDPWMPFFRAFVVVGFLVFLIFGHSKLVGGAK